MIKQLAASVLCGALLISSCAGFAATHQPAAPYQQYQQPTRNDHRGHNNQRRRAKPNGHGMYEQGRKQGWYRKGGRMPSTYRGNRYVVNNWRTYHLHQPPRGYHWVRSDNGDFLLVTITTGVIASIIAATAQR